jgi:hypothetical protein
MTKTLCLAIAILIFSASPSICGEAPLSITPFYTFNQSPLVQVHGLPAAESALIQSPGRTWSLLAIDVANNFVTRDATDESLTLDGESYRFTVALRHGLTERFEIGMDLPFIGHDGGIFDGFIEEWHRFFQLPQGKRGKAGHGRLLFAYEKDGQERLRLEESKFGIGDIRLSSGWQLYHDGSANPTAVALRASLKLPTGSSAKLHGSGSTDIALWLTGSDDILFPGEWGHLTVFISSGALAMTEGDVLKEQQEDLVGFGNLGFGWSPAQWLALKAQLAWHSPFYKESQFAALNRHAVQLHIGGTCAFSARTALDIAVSEDLTVATSPDVALHLGLSHQF